jgi:hypothetical protein
VLEGDCRTIEEALVDSSQEASPRWTVSVHPPITTSAPWLGQELDPNEVWRRNTREVICRSDALIVHGAWGGSIGVGQETAWAFDRSIPILFLQYESAPVSKQVLGMMERSFWFDLYRFRESDELRRVTAEWLAHRRPVITKGPEVRRVLAEQWEPIRTRLLERWNRERSDSGRRTSVSSYAAMHPSDIDDVLTEPLLLARTPAWKVLRLASALEVVVAPTSGLAPAVPELSPDEIGALASCKRALGWGESFTSTIAAYGARWKGAEESLVSRTGVNLRSPDGWNEIARMWRDGEIA